MSKSAVDGKHRSEGRCRLCRRPSSVRPLTRHRLIPGAFGGRYEPANCVPLCRPCHDDVDNRDYADRRRARRMLRAVLWPEEIAHARRAPMSRNGRFAFDLAYPRPPRELVDERRAEVVCD